MNCDFAGNGKDISVVSPPAACLNGEPTCGIASSRTQQIEPGRKLETIPNPGISGSCINGKQVREGADHRHSDASPCEGARDRPRDAGRRPREASDVNLDDVKATSGSGSAGHRATPSGDNPVRVAPQHGTASTPMDTWLPVVLPAGTGEPCGVQAPPLPLPAGERWDEYSQHAKEGMLDLRSLLSDGQTHQADQRQEETGTEGEGVCWPRTGWHVCTGPGLADVVHCPLLPFPSMSYYPVFQHTEPLEVVWRVWEEVNESQTAAGEPVWTPSSSDADHQCALFHFTVMSYNILAQDLLEAHPQLYSHCPLEVLDWSSRCNLLQQEILKWMPDIMCLQEVQENHYTEQLHPFLAQIGYKCVYKRRTGTKTDGCATCYRGDRFSEVSASLLELLRPGTELLDRDNVAVVLLLRPIPTPGSLEDTATAPPICIANTHLLFNPRRGDVKLAQLAIVLAEIDATVKAFESRGQQCNVILCGDFNAVPYMSLYQFITSGQLYYHSLPAWMVSGLEDLSYKAHHYRYRLYAPLWPSSLGVTAGCQYTASQEKDKHSNKGGKLQYSHEFLHGLRFCPAACVRPVDLEFIPYVTDSTPDISGKNFLQAPSMGPTISHGLSLRSVYKHVLPGLGHPEVTTLHSEAGAAVDYIFYTPKGDRLTVRLLRWIASQWSLELTGYLSLLSEEVLWSMKGLPNEHFASDHLSLLAKFQLDLSAAL
ncbi:Protein angel 1 [Merluccius polli]|uniref:Protein angel 1 n=1 Tax=Merluccius polli TaxID=89951 RepID=A0AA47NXI4_MERPO|nr:Protein angel 1 [Merluccius polli]